MSRIDNVVVDVCRLPLDFHAIRTVSEVDLVQRSGYLAVRTEVTVDRLMACLREHPDWVEGWFDWSADNRSSPAWYVIEANPGEFQLGFYDGPGSRPSMTFTDKTQAAAEFVFCELEQVAGGIERRRQPSQGNTTR